MPFFMIQFLMAHLSDAIQPQKGAKSMLSLLFVSVVAPVVVGVILELVKDWLKKPTISAILSQTSLWQRDVFQKNKKKTRSFGSTSVSVVSNAYLLFVNFIITFFCLSIFQFYLNSRFLLLIKNVQNYFSQFVTENLFFNSCNVFALCNKSLFIPNSRKDFIDSLFILSKFFLPVII